jgi:hypothetical protein
MSEVTVTLMGLEKMSRMLENHFNDASKYELTVTPSADLRTTK